MLKENLVLTGDMTAELYISSDAPDTDFVVRVTDVDENYRSIKLADGLLSARYRNGFARSEFLQEGEIVCLKIRTTKLSNCFRKGHRIRVTVTSSAKNFIFPNSNTREGFASARTVVAHNRVYHGGLHASRLTVRVEPKLWIALPVSGLNKSLCIANHHMQPRSKPVFGFVNFRLMFITKQAFFITAVSVCVDVEPCLWLTLQIRYNLLAHFFVVFNFKNNGLFSEF